MKSIASIVAGEAEKPVAGFLGKEATFSGAWSTKTVYTEQQKQPNLKFILDTSC
jgi:hypothetical protein